MVWLPRQPQRLLNLQLSAGSSRRSDWPVPWFRSVMAIPCLSPTSRNTRVSPHRTFGLRQTPLVGTTENTQVVQRVAVEARISPIRDGCQDSPREALAPPNLHCSPAMIAIMLTRWLLHRPPDSRATEASSQTLRRSAVALQNRGHRQPVDHLARMTSSVDAGCRVSNSSSHRRPSCK